MAQGGVPGRRASWGEGGGVPRKRGSGKNETPERRGRGERFVSPGGGGSTGTRVFRAVPDAQKSQAPRAGRVERGCPPTQPRGAPLQTQSEAGVRNRRGEGSLDPGKLACSGLCQWSPDVRGRIEIGISIPDRPLGWPDLTLFLPRSHHTQGG